MVQFLAKVFIKEDGTEPSAVRKAYGVLCGIVGIFLNVCLFAGKLIAGTLSNSVAITADAFNNLSDAGSSFITLIGFQMAGAKPDPNHPFGHGRIEYLSGLAVSLAILLMAVELIRDSVAKILHPEQTECSVLTVAILVAAILVKLYMSFYNHRIGQKIDSAAMKATAMDSLSDMASTTAVLAATLIGHFTKLQIDGYCGVLVGLFILYAGINAARETLNPLLGQPPAKEYVEEIERIVMAHEGISGIHDLIVHDYGPGRQMITLHAEVPAEGDILEIHDEIDLIEMELKEKLGCLATIHMDPVVTKDAQTANAKAAVKKILSGIAPEISLHDFRMVTGPTHTNLIFDIVIPYKFRMKDEEILEKLTDGIRNTLGEQYYAVVNVDRDFSGN